MSGVTWKYHDDVEFIWHGMWNDSELLWNGKLCNAHDIEDAIHNEFIEYAHENDIEDNEDNFTEFCHNNPDSILEHIYVATGGEL